MSFFYVFVYGTLRQGGRNNILLETATLIEKDALTRQSIYKMQQNQSAKTKGAFAPSVVRAETGTAQGYIQGDVYQVDQRTLEALDSLEGYSPSKPKDQNNYCREMIETQSGLKAFIYIGTQNLDVIDLPYDRVVYYAKSRVYSWVLEPSL